MVIFSVDIKEIRVFLEISISEACPAHLMCNLLIFHPIIITIISLLTKFSYQLESERQ